MIRKVLKVSDGSIPPPPSKQKWFKKRILKVPVWLWIFCGFVLIGLLDDATKAPEEQSSDKIEVSPANTPETTSSSVVIEQRIGVEYQNLSIDCSGSDLTGTVDVFNSGNVSISGRVEVPIETTESFMVPLSGVFLDVPASETAKITLETSNSCRKDQIVGEPFTVFTIPSIDNLQKLNIKDAFEWSDVRVSCDTQSALVRLEATVKNVSSFELTAGFEARVQNGPLSEAEKEAGVRGTLYRGNTHKIQSGESRRIKFGYGGFCLKGKYDGPYITEFETVFTY